VTQLCLDAAPTPRRRGAQRGMRLVTRHRSGREHQGEHLPGETRRANDPKRVATRGGLAHGTVSRRRPLSVAALPGRGIGTQARTRLWSTGLSGRLGSAAPSSSHVPGVSWRPAQRGHVVAGVRVSGSRWRGVEVVGQGRRRERPRKAEARRHGRSKVSNGPVQAGNAGRSLSSGFICFRTGGGGASLASAGVAASRPVAFRWGIMG